MRKIKLMAVGIMVMALAATSLAQAVTEADLGRLNVATTEVAGLAATLKASDATLAAEVERSLALLKEEVVYLRVVLRKEGSVSRTEYTDVRDRIETLRIRARGEKVTAQPILADDPMPESRVFTIPVATQMDVRLQTALNSGTARIEQRFEATTVVDLELDGRVALPAGAVVRGFVGSVSPAGRVERKGSLALAFDELIGPSGPTRFRASVMQALEGKRSEDISRIGTGAVVGAVLGGLLGGGKGLLVGVLVGGGGTIAATDGTDVDLPIGTILRLRVDSPVVIR